MIPHWFWHPMNGQGYQFWSGIGSDLGELTIVAGLVSIGLMTWRRFNCHADGCWRLVWHVHDGHGHPVCRRHHPDGGNVAHTIGAPRGDLDDVPAPGPFA